MHEESFSLVLGIQDAYPETDLAKLRRYLCFSIPIFNNISTNIILAINEIEAWFIAEETHYERISPRLIIETVNAMCNIDIKNDTTDKIPHPTETLKQIYMRCGTTYDKSKTKAERTVDYLDYENLYINIRK